MPRALTIRDRPYFRRPCGKCGNTFRPTGISSRTCPECLIKSQEALQIKLRKFNEEKKRKNRENKK